MRHVHYTHRVFPSLLTISWLVMKLLTLHWVSCILVIKMLNCDQVDNQQDQYDDQRDKDDN